MPLHFPLVRPLLLSLCLALGVMLAADVAPAQAPVYHGNVQSHIYHRQSCRYFDCKACTAVFKSREEAEKLGYRPCKVCKP